MEEFPKFLVIFVQRYVYPCLNKIGTKKPKTKTKQNKNKTKIKQKQKTKNKTNKQTNKNTFWAISQKYNF